MIDKQKLREDLLDAFKLYVYRQDMTDCYPRCTSDACDLRFRTDPHYQVRVESLVDGVMIIVDQNIKGGESDEY